MTELLVLLHPHTGPRRLLRGLALVFLLAAGLSGADARAQSAAQGAPVVGTIQLPGRTNVPEDVVLGALKLQVGQPFTPAGMEADRKAILGLGFFRSVTASQQTAGNKA